MDNDKKYKILYLMEFPIDLPGGGQMSTQTLCEGIAGEEFEPVVACPTLLTKKESDYSFRIRTYKSDENREKNKILRVLNFLRRIGSFYRIIRSEKPDLIHVSMSESLITFGFLRCLGIFRKIPFVYTDRGLAYGYRAHSLKCILATMKRAYGMITTTHYNERLWLDRKVAAPITVIHNTISTAFDTYDDSMREQMRSKFGIQEGELVIGFAGRISEEKDWDFVPVLVEELHRGGVEFKVALVISVYEQQDQAITEDIRSRIAAVIGEENLIYQQDLSQAQIADYYYMVDIFVMSSMFESFGKAAVEAMSRKCCVLSTSVGGLTEVIGREEDLYTKETVDKFVNRCRELKNNPALLSEERDYFYNRYHDNFMKDIHFAKHKDLYRQALKK